MSVTPSAAVSAPSANAGDIACHPFRSARHAATYPNTAETSGTATRAGWFGAKLGPAYRSTMLATNGIAMAAATSREYRHENTIAGRNNAMAIRTSHMFTGSPRLAAEGAEVEVDARS